MVDRTGDTTVTVDTNAWVSVGSLDDFAELRKSHLESSPYWWPEIGPLRDTSSISFAYRMRRLGPITVRDLVFQNDVWVDGGEIRPHYHIALPAATSSATVDSEFSVDPTSGSVAVYRPEGKAGMSGHVGRLLAVMIDRHAV
jgi:hypothetical protein